jgi:hypothetical protein
MADRLSIISGDEQIDPNPSTRDRFQSWLPPIIKAISKLSGLEPWGSLMTETVSQIMPDQRQERIIRLIDVLNIRYGHLAEDLANLRQRLQSPEGTDLLEDALGQASRAASHERLEYIASLLANGLSDDDLEHAGKKIMFSLLEQTSDAEIIILKYHSIRSAVEKKKFAETHEKLLAPAILRFRADQQEINRVTLRATYTRNLARRGLLRLRYSKPKKGETPEFDERTGTLKPTGTEITALGAIFLRYIGIPADWTPLF